MPGPSSSKGRGGAGGDGGATRVLFIGGTGRSGSTLLQRLLNGVDGLTAVGEVRYIWSRSFGKNHPCGCGAPFTECRFWTDVLHTAYGGPGGIDGAEIDRVRRRVDRFFRIPALVTTNGSATGAFAQDLRRFRAVLASLYRGIAETAGARVIVDASKGPAYAYVLNNVPTIDLRIVHLVRDSRSVAFSNQRRKAWSDEGSNRWLPRRSVWGSAARYLAHNIPFHFITRLGCPRLLVRYEDLMADPAATLRRVLAFVGESPDADLGFLGDGTAELSPSHTISGNPMRHQHGRVPLRFDDEWLAKMPMGSRLAVTALTSPLLVLYRYDLAARAHRFRPR